MRPFYYCLLVVAAIVSGCASRTMRTIWKSDTRAQPYQRIMAVAIVKEDSGSFRAAIESAVVAELTRLNYRAVAAGQAFGAHGLASLGEEGTYRALCDSGIDAVLVIAMIGKLTERKDFRKITYTGLHYYQRIWSYRSLQQDLPGLTPNGDLPSVWEGVVFDLSRLQPQLVVQSELKRVRADSSSLQQLARKMVSGMLKKRVG